MEKDEIKKILENHLEVLSIISNDKQLLSDNPLLMLLLTESLKTTSVTLFFLDKIWHWVFWIKFFYFFLKFIQTFDTIN